MRIGCVTHDDTMQGISSAKANEKLSVLGHRRRTMRSRHPTVELYITVSMGQSTVRAWSVTTAHRERGYCRHEASNSSNASAYAC